jgi:DNA-binding CsgD family transcriptional regulator
MAYTYQTCGDAIRFGSAVAVGSAEPVFERIAQCVLHEDPYAQRFIYRHGGAFTSVSQIFKMRREFDDQPFVRDRFHALGVHDFLSMNATDTSGLGVIITAPLANVEWASRPMQLHWSRTAAHVAAAFRLRRGLGAAGPMRDADAVLKPDGRLEHGPPEACVPGAREALSGAVKAREAARSSPEDDALGAWTALVHGRWSVVDFFDSDGKRFLVARRNDPTTDEKLALTATEAQVLGMARLAHGYKLIAYELGLPASTVGNTLNRALRKVGLASRSELIRAMGAPRTASGNGS